MSNHEANCDKHCNRTPFGLVPRLRLIEEAGRVGARCRGKDEEFLLEGFRLIADAAHEILVLILGEDG